MKYFSMFSGIGGFELGIQRSSICRSIRSPKTESQTTSVKGVEECQSDMGLLGDNANSDNRSQAICDGGSEGGELGIRQSETKSKDSTNGESGASQLPRRSLCIGYSEIDKYAVQIYEKHFKGHKNYGNCTNIRWNNVYNFELLCGGFPCQSFSIAGKRRGFSDTRGMLFFEIARCLREKQPRLFLLENVKGLLSHDKGNMFLTILTTLDELGYDCQWQVLNSKNFGVPQNRERVFIVGHLRGTSRPEVFPVTQSSEQNVRSSKQNTQERGDKPNSINSIWRTPLTGNMRIRRLTPTECERLQGFPDGWTEKGIDINGNEVIISDTQRYKVLGNAVTTNVITEIARRLLCQ